MRAAISSSDSASLLLPMDKNQIITQAINALITMVTTIVTTIIVVRLSTKGNLGVISKLKTRFTPKLRAYIELIVSAAFFIYLSSFAYRFFSAPNPPPVTRSQARGLILFVIGSFFWFFATVALAAKLVNIYGDEKEQKEKELRRKFDEEQAALLKPTIDKLNEAIRKSEEFDSQRMPDPLKTRRLEPSTGLHRLSLSEPCRTS
jgi:beta-lactamase regulating signal transducer with metallopeptidase domain